MSAIELPALIGSHPLGALASFGLVRLLSANGKDAALSFIEKDDWIAVLHGEFATREDLIAHLGDWVSRRSDAMLQWTGDSDVRVEDVVFREALQRAVELPDLELALFLTAFVADGSKDRSKGLAKPTPFYMASGQQSFIHAFRDLLDAVRRDPVGAFREALVGPWTYATPLWGAGWDPGTERNYALRHRAPTAEKTSCVAGAVWLAFEALPLFPAFTDGHGGDGCTAFVKPVRQRRLDPGAADEEQRRRRWELTRRFRWPVPTTPVHVDSLAVLLATPADALTERSGIGAIYESERSEFGQGYAVLRPAVRYAGAVAPVRGRRGV